MTLWPAPALLLLQYLTFLSIYYPLFRVILFNLQDNLWRQVLPHVYNSGDICSGVLRTVPKATQLEQAELRREPRPLHSTFQAVSNTAVLLEVQHSLFFYRQQPLTNSSYSTPTTASEVICLSPTSHCAKNSTGQ